MPSANKTWAIDIGRHMVPSSKHMAAAGFLLAISISLPLLFAPNLQILAPDNIDQGWAIVLQNAAAGKLARPSGGFAFTYLPPGWFYSLSVAVSPALAPFDIFFGKLLRVLLVCAPIALMCGRRLGLAAIALLATAIISACPFGADAEVLAMQVAIGLYLRRVSTEKPVQGHATMAFVFIAGMLFMIPMLSKFTWFLAGIVMATASALNLFICKKHRLLAALSVGLLFGAGGSALIAGCSVMDITPATKYSDT